MALPAVLNCQRTARLGMGGEPWVFMNWRAVGPASDLPTATPYDDRVEQRLDARRGARRCRGHREPLERIGAGLSAEAGDG